MRPLDTLLREGAAAWGSPRSAAAVPALGSASARRDVESWLSRPRGLAPVHRGRSELLEQSPEVVDVLARARAL